MALAVIVTFKVKPEQFGAFTDYLCQSLPDTRAFDGCLGLEVAMDPEASIVILHEIWRSKDHQLAYRAWRGERGDGEKFASFQREPASFVDYQTLEIPRV